jgi:hypothetical protein
MIDKLSDLSMYPILQKGIVGRVIADEAVIVLPEKGQVKVLNDVGARVWELVNGQRTLEVIISMICLEYEVAPDQAEADIIEFINQLEQKGIIELSPNPEDIQG